MPTGAEAAPAAGATLEIGAEAAPAAGATLETGDPEASPKGPPWSGKKKELGKIKEEEPSSSTGPGPEPLKKGEKLGTVMVDFHNTLEVHDDIPEENQEAIWSLLKKGYDVVVCSFAGRQRALEVNDTMVAQDFYQHLKKCFCISSRCGNGGKADQCKKLGCTVIFDDGADICCECYNHGLQVFPITHPKEKHQWWEAMGGKTYPTLADAVKTFLHQEGV